MKPTILFILHLPPPVHGASMMGKYIHDSEVVNGAFDCHYINLTTAKNLADIGKVGLRKLVQFVELLNRIRKEVKRLKPQLVYVTPNACGGAFYKDFVVVQLLKAMGCKVVAHYHNKGVATRQDRKLDSWLYRRFIQDIRVMLLAEPLYADMERFVKREQVLFCPNGIPESAAPALVERKEGVPRIFFLSNLLIDKGVLTLLDACKRLKEQGKVFRCDFVGGETADMDAERFEQECVERGLTDCVTYHGRKYGEEKLTFFRQTDVFVLLRLMSVFLWCCWRRWSRACLVCRVPSGERLRLWTKGRRASWFLAGRWSRWRNGLAGCWRMKRCGSAWVLPAGRSLKGSIRCLALKKRSSSVWRRVCNWTLTA